jgi:hypothetical protein
MRGKYSECGKAFSKVGRAAGRHIAGKPFCLYYDAEYKDDDADIEACFPIRKEVKADGISVRVLRRLHAFHCFIAVLIRSSAGPMNACSERRRTRRRAGPANQGSLFERTWNDLSRESQNYLTEIQLP